MLTGNKTPTTMLATWLNTIDVLITPLVPVTNHAFNVIAHMEHYLRQLDLDEIEPEELQGPILGKLMYQYCAIVGQLEVQGRIMGVERITFLKKTEAIYRTFIDKIERKFNLRQGPLSWTLTE